ncbi:hypothetical protein SAMN06265182_0530 [Persephonella hydrogeniphila]|uniref:Spermatogenesis-associated protein 20-like TRX domain-containing protein n=1 Tax=Persephonella hydrogeniphila TaxID=198703 RepID=A0A285N3I2_9AQUI|nr:DUF255 domain-containing protein [Persephonella hydrogeniphila]SNZ04015.1 hypothetical protein SAMN06265182_0530 [Persephonella hydrogeniphila]
MRFLAVLLILISLSYGSEIKWYSFEEGLKKATEDKKLILLDIYAQWCHWCNVMENTTYRDKDVIKIIEKHYIPVRVDAEKRPDINKRYNQGGLPSTVILDSNGNILWGGIYLSPEDMYRVLSYFASLNPQQIKKISEENKKKSERIKKRFFMKVKEKEPSPSYIKKVFKSVKIRFDSENGGFYGYPKFPEEELPHFLLIYWKFFNSKEAKNMLTKTVEGYMKLIDPVEEGIFRYSVNEFWTQPHYEKLLKDQADLSVMFFDIYGGTTDKKYLRSAISLLDFSIERLYSRENSLFYNSQGADIVDEDGTLLMTGEEFFVLGRKDRERAIKELGYSPKIEKEFYYGVNALMSKALLYGYAFTKNDKYKTIGIAVLNRVISESFTKKGVYYSKDNKDFYLSQNIYTLEALITAYQLTGKIRYLKKAEELFSILKKHYFSKKLKILTDFKDTGLSTNRISFIDDIFLLNRRAVHYFYYLYLLTGKTEYRDFADILIKHLPGKVNINTAIGFFIYLYPPLSVHIYSCPEVLPEIFSVFPYWVSVHTVDSEEVKKLGYIPEKKCISYICNADLCFFKVDKTEDIPEFIHKSLNSYKTF